MKFNYFLQARAPVSPPPPPHVNSDSCALVGYVRDVRLMSYYASSLSLTPSWCLLLSTSLSFSPFLLVCLGSTVCSSAHLCVKVPLSVPLPICVSRFHSLSLCPSVCQGSTLCPSVHLCVKVPLSLPLSICLPRFHCLSLCPSVCQGSTASPSVHMSA